MIQLGDRVRDKITGLTGIVVCKAQWLNGCDRVAVQPEKLNKDGKPRDIEHFDIEQVEIVRAKKFQSSKRPAGGPMPSPKRAADPKR